MPRQIKIVFHILADNGESQEKTEPKTLSIDFLDNGGIDPYASRHVISVLSSEIARGLLSLQGVDQERCKVAILELIALTMDIFPKIDSEEDIELQKRRKSVGVKLPKWIEKKLKNGELTAEGKG